MQDGVFPSKLKIAKVTPIFKNGCRYTAPNYRPISVLSPFSKIFEKIIYNRPVVPERGGGGGGGAAASPALLSGGARGAELPFAFQYDCNKANAC